MSKLGDPHRQFILDLQAWVEHDLHEIILTIDVNETYEPESTGPFSPLQYKPGIPTACKTHNGKLSTLITTCGLQDPLPCNILHVRFHHHTYGVAPELILFLSVLTSWSHFFALVAYPSILGFPGPGLDRTGRTVEEASNST